MQKKTTYLLLPVALLAAWSSVRAVCPVCTLAVGAGLSFFKKYGIDDTVIGIWVGAFIASSIAWTIAILTHYGIKFKGRKPLVAVLYLFLFIWPLYHYNYIGIPLNTIWGYDKLLLGIIVGIITFTIACIGYNYLKAKNGGRANFPFQKVLMPIGFVSLLSLIFYLITK